eukprot:scaffold14471_cov113-Isochrysis_galbana.AAC.2
MTRRGGSAAAGSGGGRPDAVAAAARWSAAAADTAAACANSIAKLSDAWDTRRRTGWSLARRRVSPSHCERVRARKAVCSLGLGDSSSGERKRTGAQPARCACGSRASTSSTLPRVTRTRHSGGSAHACPPAARPPV